MKARYWYLRMLITRRWNNGGTEVLQFFYPGALPVLELLVKRGISIVHLDLLVFLWDRVFGPHAAQQDASSPQRKFGNDAGKCFTIAAIQWSLEAMKRVPVDINSGEHHD